MRGKNEEGNHACLFGYLDGEVTVSCHGNFIVVWFFTEERSEYGAVCR